MAGLGVALTRRGPHVEQGRIRGHVRRVKPHGYGVWVVAFDCRDRHSS
jgi:hypothetical protein